jgi:hypothetical protein
MMVDKQYLVILVVAVFRCSLFANEPTVQHENDETWQRMREERLAKINELLLLTQIIEADYNSKEAKLPDLDDLLGIGDSAIISKIKISEVPPSIIYETPLPSQKRFSLELCSPDLTVFHVYIHKPKSFSLACDLIHGCMGLLAPSSIVPYESIGKYYQPKLEGDNYSFIVDRLTDTRLTRLSIERGIIIGVELLPFLQPPGAPEKSREAVLTQMNEIVDALIALFDGGGDITDEQEEHYNKIKAAYKAVEPDPAIVETERGTF